MTPAALISRRGWLLALLLVATTCISSPSAGNTSSSTNGICQPLSSEFDFVRRPPRAASDLAFCKEYRASTCCDHKSTLAVLRSLSPLFASESDVAASFSDRCRQLTSTIACAPCHPEVGTRQRIGVCPQLCSEWYHACQQGLYTHADGVLRPCVEGSLICAPLHTIVVDGAAFCEATGVGAGQISSLHGALPDAVHALFRRSEREDVRLATAASMMTAAAPDDGEPEIDEDELVTCFDGSIPTGRGPRSTPASASSSSAAADREADIASARRRYYKSSEELAELERKRAERTAARETDQRWEQQPLVQVYRALQRTLQPSLQTLHRAWRRLIRRLPLPYSVSKHLEGTVALCLVCMLVNTLIWSVLTRLLARICGGRRRGPRGTARLAVDGLPSETSLLSSAGLTQDDIRQLRMQTLIQKQYAEPGRINPISFSGKPPPATATTTTAAAAPAAAATPSKGTYTTVIDGELVTLPE